MSVGQFLKIIKENSYGRFGGGGNDFDLQFYLDLGVATHIFMHKFKGNIVLNTFRYICKSQNFYMP